MSDSKPTSRSAADGAPNPDDANRSAGAHPPGAERTVTPPSSDPSAPSVPLHDGPKTIFGRPVEGFSFVKGGTTSAKHDQMEAASVAEGDRRRAVADRERQIAAVPIEQGGGMLLSHNLASQSAQGAQQLYVLLHYLTPRGDVARHEAEELHCLADIFLLDGDELSLKIVCPRCKERRHQQNCQLDIRQSNKHWTLDRTPWDGQSMGFPHKQGQPMEFEGQVYLSAGVVNCERFRCPACSWSARIDNNRVWPD